MKGSDFHFEMTVRGNSGIQMPPIVHARIFVVSVVYGP